MRPSTFPVAKRPDKVVYTDINVPRILFLGSLVTLTRTLPIQLDRVMNCRGNSSAKKTSIGIQRPVAYVNLNPTLYMWRVLVELSLAQDNTIPMSWSFHAENAILIFSLLRFFVSVGSDCCASERFPHD